MEIQNQFKRYEIKYLLDSRRYSAVRRAMEGRTVGDEYGRSTVCNVYYDTPDHPSLARKAAVQGENAAAQLRYAARGQQGLS